MTEKLDHGLRTAVLLAIGLGLGYLPVAPGSWGSLGALGLYALLQAWLPSLSVWLGATREWTAGLAPFVAIHGAMIVLLALAGVWAAQRAATYFRCSDPAPVVIDEICGQLIVFIGLAPLSWKYLVSGFLLFRAFDIVKPFPARRAESWPGGWGIMADDWFAGAYAALVLRLAMYLRL